MAAIDLSEHPVPLSPSEIERQLALESIRRLGPSLADLVATEGGDDPGRTVDLIVQIRGRPASQPLAIPASALRLLGSILAEMARGNAVALTTIHSDLTTRQAAELLGVSRLFVRKLIDDGEIPPCKVGRQRRIKLSDLMDYKNRIDTARSCSLDELVAQAQELDMGY